MSIHKYYKKGEKSGRFNKGLKKVKKRVFLGVLGVKGRYTPKGPKKA